MYVAHKLMYVLSFSINIVLVKMKIHFYHSLLPSPHQQPKPPSKFFSVTVSPQLRHLTHISSKSENESEKNHLNWNNIISVNTGRLFNHIRIFLAQLLLIQFRNISSYNQFIILNLYCFRLKLSQKFSFISLTFIIVYLLEIISHILLFLILTVARQLIVLSYFVLPLIWSPPFLCNFTGGDFFIRIRYFLLNRDCLKTLKLILPQVAKAQRLPFLNLFSSCLCVLVVKILVLRQTQ